jgi:hypothetical protein
MSNAAPAKQDPLLLKTKVIELAAGIFTRLIGDNAKLTEKGISLGADPTSLAQLSFKLAQVFQKVEDDINADALPKNVGFKLDGADISSWGKEAPPAPK